MNTYIWQLFLMTPVSMPRITNALLEKGFTIHPWCKGGKMSIHNDGAPSTLMSIKLVPFIGTDIGMQDIDTLLKKMLIELDVPYYGYTLMYEVGDRSVLVSTGRIPEQRKLHVIPAGPYRTQGEVIPFQKKDDGIISD